MNDTKWVYLDADTLENKVNVSQKKKIAGVDVQVRYSPYDVPTAMRVSRESDIGRVNLEFRYIGTDEASDVIHLGDDIDVSLGKYSKRIYSISIAQTLVKRAKTSEQMKETFADAFIRLQEKLLAMQANRNRYRQENYDAANNAMKAKKRDIFSVSDLTPATV